MLKYLYDHQCNRCSISSTLSEDELICVPGDGPLYAKGMILGEAPGAQEAREGKPFIGDAGAVLNEALNAAMLSRDSIFVSNVVRCRPTEANEVSGSKELSRRNRPPTDNEREICRIYFDRELKAINPIAIMTLGNHALTAVTGEWGITRLIGKWQFLENGEFHPIGVLPNYHPAYILRNRSLFNEFVSVVREFAGSLEDV